jgi:hypothetical protein
MRQKTGANSLHKIQWDNNLRLEEIFLWPGEPRRSDPPESGITPVAM